MSYGNSETIVPLDQHKHTIITAKNGSGKSSIIDAICYALYGKPYRDINLGQLVNSINKKNLLVKIEFSIGDVSYVVIRGQKPSVFEIYKNSELIPQDAATADYQEMLESKIIGINFKTFKQIVIIGSASYVPFMNLKAAERRTITEEVLDIAVFSTMLEIAKKMLTESKSSLDSVVYEISLLKTQIESQKDMISVMEAEEKFRDESLESKIEELRKGIQSAEDEVYMIDSELVAIGDMDSKKDSIDAARMKIQVKLSELKSKMNDVTSSINFYDHSECPTCNQPITEDIRISKQTSLRETSEKLSKSESDTKELLATIDMKLKYVVDMLQMRSGLILKRNEYLATIKQNNRTLSDLTASKKTSSDSVEFAKTKLKQLVESLMEKVEQKSSLTLDHVHYKTAVDILRDNGIKSKVIATFIPVMNQLINEYLQKFELFVQFELNELFEETIKSRHRDTFSYASFSEGEKMRIDLAILFAWRKIAESRNSISTNLLVFDEVLDKSLDDDAIDVLLNILETVEDGVNSIIISHRNVVPELFDRHITINKHKDFSILTS